MKPSSEVSEFLVFKIGSVNLALEAFRVQEVMKCADITPIPRMPKYLPGVINMRGDVVAVIHLGLILGIRCVEDKITDWLVIVETRFEEEPMKAAIPVDTVHDVIRLSSTGLSPPPEIGIDINNEFIRWVGIRNDEYLIIIDVDKVISTLRTDLYDSQPASYIKKD